VRAGSEALYHWGLFRAAGFGSSARYNRMVKSTRLSAIALGLIIAALLAGCKKNIDNNDAVKQGVSAYLSKRTDLLSMDVNVTSVSYKDNEATALVRFQAKNNSSPNAGMNMQYVLERKGDQWVVKGRAGSEAHVGTPQGAPGAADSPSSLGAMPNTGSGSLGAMPGSSPQLPPGHPSIGGAAPGSTSGGTLPPGHPAIPQTR
jgi:hypothetical protein